MQDPAKLANVRASPKTDRESSQPREVHIHGRNFRPNRLQNSQGTETDMNLSTRLAHEFSAVVRQRGQGYYWKGLVDVEHANDSEVEARVRGSRTYEVSLDWAGGVLSAWCDCRYFYSSGACKHLWATILAAESHGYLSRAASATYLLLDSGDSYLDEEFDDESSAFAMTPRLRFDKHLAPKPPGWRKQVTELSGHHRPVARPGDGWPSRRQILYVVDVPSSLASAGVVLSLESRICKLDGSWTRPTTLNLKREQIAQLPLAEDRELLSALAGGVSYHKWGYTGFHEPLSMSCLVPHPLAAVVLPLAARTGRGYSRLARNSEGLAPLAWDEGGHWQFGLEIRRSTRRMGAGRRFPPGRGTVWICVPRSWSPQAVSYSRPIAWRRSPKTRLLNGSLFSARLVRSRRPKRDQDELLAALLCSPSLPALDVPEEMRYEETTVQPRPCLRIRADGRSYRARAGDCGRNCPLTTKDGSRRLEPSRGCFEAAARRVLRRDSAAENAAAELLGELGLKFQAPTDREPSAGLGTGAHQAAARRPAHWSRRAGTSKPTVRSSGVRAHFRVEVSTGVDWFELHGEVEYGETTAKLPALLEALRRGENMVRLDDGTYGVLPEEWLRRIGCWPALGAPERRPHPLPPEPGRAAGCAAGHAARGPLRRNLRPRPRGTAPVSRHRGRRAARRFRGLLARLPARRAGLDGVPAPLLVRRLPGRRHGRGQDRPGAGAARDAPRVASRRRDGRARRWWWFRGRSSSTGSRRRRASPRNCACSITLASERNGDDFAAYDVILTTYGTLRRDAVRLKDVEFDYVVLDEAQAVKNAGTESAKAVRLLRGGHRLALSGTPVENHLGELWTLFEFLNPGMLGAASVFKLAGGAARNPDEETRRLLAHALRPFILRRTKEQVARELPAKTEQTVYCELEPAQRKLYDELRQHYRNSLLQRIETEGLAKSKIQVLEALLRLRQAACHPGLIDPKRPASRARSWTCCSSNCARSIDEGHKALVFSQFTSLLRIVRDRLDASGSPTSIWMARRATGRRGWSASRTTRIAGSS